MDTLFLNEQRCACGKLLLKGIFFDGTLEIKCKKCGAINKIGSIKLADDDNHYLLIINDKGIIVNVSTSACKILGYTHEELIGLHFTKINTTAPKNINDKFFGSESILNEDNYFQLDTFHQSKSGNKIPVSVHLKLYQPSGKEKLLLASVELINNKNLINNTDSKFINNACDFYLDIDKNGIIERMSKIVKEFLGFSQDEIIGKNYFDLIPDEIKNESKKTYEYFLDKEQPYRVISDSKKDKNNKIIYDEIYFTPNYNDMGKLVGYRVLIWVKKNSTIQATILKFILIPIITTCAGSMIDIFHLAKDL